jgi:hypothetical protein
LFKRGSFSFLEFPENFWKNVTIYSENKFVMSRLTINEDERKAIMSLHKIQLNEEPIPSMGGPKKQVHPMDNPFLKQMISNVEGDNVETVEYVPNQKLVINAFGNVYTITLRKE